MEKLKCIYKRWSGKRTFNVWVSAILGVIIFFVKMATPDEHLIEGSLVGMTAIIVLSFHTYFVQSFSLEKIKETSYWKDKFNRHTWLLDSIRNLIGDKISIFSSNQKYPENFRDKSIKLILQMIYEFYKSCDLCKQPVQFRIIFQEPSDDKQYLAVKYWYYSDGRNPHYANKPEAEKRLFSVRVDPNQLKKIALPVKAWSSQKTEVFENSAEIPHHYDGQNEFVKSIISYPVIGRDGATLVGVITVSADKDDFFKRIDIKDHEEYLVEFGTRIAMELLAKKPRGVNYGTAI